MEELKEKVGITRMEDITALDRLNIPVYLASRPGAKERAVSVYTGKGLTREQARVSVIMEAIERYSAGIKAKDRAEFLFESYDEGEKKKWILFTAIYMHTFYASQNYVLYLFRYIVS